MSKTEHPKRSKEKFNESTLRLIREMKNMSIESLVYLRNYCITSPLIFQALTQILTLAANNQPSLDTKSSKLHTNRLSWGHLRTQTSNRSWVNQCSVCPLLRSLRSLYSHQDLDMTKKAHKCTLSVREGWFFSSSKPSPHRNSPHRSAVPEAKVLTGVAQWGGNQTSPFFFLTAWPTGRPAYLQVLNLNPTLAVLEGWRGSSTVYSSSLVIQGFVCYPFGLEWILGYS